MGSNAALVMLLLFAVSNARFLERVLVDEAMEAGALCLDGSLPGYFIGKGSGSGADKWIVHQGGGGWCNTTSDCLVRTNSPFGSSKFWPPLIPFGGIFSDEEAVNGEFYNWNVVYLGYCDGGSFSGFLEDPVVVGDATLYFRGKPIFLTLVQHLLDSGMENATDIILTGCSAGGVATFLHADLMTTLIPDGINYKAMADGGYIPNVRTVDGELGFQEYIMSVYALHNVSDGLDEDCVASFNPEERWRCLFAPYTMEFIQSPIFVLNSIYDELILELLVGLDCLPPMDCSQEQTKTFQNYRTEFLAQLAPAVNASAGIFADSCLIHCQTLEDKPWSTFVVANRTMRQSFEDWYFERGSVDQRIDCPFPCNPSCPLESPIPTPTPSPTPTASAGAGAKGGSLGLVAALAFFVLSRALF